MADNNNNTGLIMEVENHENEMNGDNTVGEMTTSIVHQGDMGITDEDILSEAANFPETVQLQYTLPDEGSVVPLPEAAVLQQDTEQISYIASEAVETTDQTFNPENFIQQAQSEVIEGGNVIEEIENIAQKNNLESDNALQNVTRVIPQSVILTRQVPQTISAPLGSSQNPIRIIQQGNQYTPVQQLSKDQMQQIMHVVQQQQSVKNVPNANVLFNSQTNTKIVYRVIYPSQIHKGGESASSENTVQTPKRIYKKRLREDDLDKVDGPELSKEEKEARKKTRQKTRSGRVSKPPKHMVKDFKHIHVLDYDEDYDDSDGGYSDFKYSEGEEESPGSTKKNEDDNFIAYGLDTNKPKNWKCITCGKAYIGRAGLARHLRLNASHGSIDPDGDGDMEPPDPSVYPTSTEENVTVNGNLSTANSTGSLSEDSRDSTLSLTYTSNLTTNSITRPRGTGQRGRPRGSRSVMRGRGVYAKMDPETRRKSRLKELTRECTDDELMEIVLPRLAKVITVWEFLLMKVEKGDPAWPHADDIYREYERLHEHVRKLCREYLQYLPPEPDTPAQADTHNVLKVENVVVAEALGLKVGPHKVKDVTESDPSIVQHRYKFNPPNSTNRIDTNNKPDLKRTVEAVSPSVSPAKKPKIVISPAKSKIVPIVDQQVLTNRAVNKLVETPKFTNSTGVKKPNSNMKALLASKVGKAPNAVVSGKSVSLLSSSLSSKVSTPSLPSFTSSAQTVLNSSQKLIVVSGTGQSNAVSNIPNSTTNTNTMNTVSLLYGNNKNDPLNEVGGQLIGISNTQTVLPQNKVLIHDSVTGSYSFAELPNTIQQPVSSVSNTLSQPVFISLPQGTVGSQYLQPKLVLSEGNMISPISTASNFVANNIDGHFVNILQPTDNQTSMNTVNALETGNNSNLLLSYPTTVSQPLVQQDIQTGSVYMDITEAGSSQDQVVFVNPQTMFLNDQDRGKINSNIFEEEGVCTEVLMSNEEEQVGIINSVDSGGVEVKTEIVNIVNEEAVNVNDEAKVEDGEAIVGEFEDVNSVNLQDNELNSMAAVIDKEPVVTYENVDPETVLQDTIAESDDTANVQSIESLQIAGSSIFQTEDGVILIQNPDGTTLQLQGSDGQPVSLEAVQAMLGVDGETQFITEVNQ